MKQTELISITNEWNQKRKKRGHKYDECYRGNNRDTADAMGCLRWSQNHRGLFVFHRNWDGPSSSSISPRNKHRWRKFWFAEQQGFLFQVLHLELLPSSSPCEAFSSRKLQLACLPQLPWPRITRRCVCCATASLIKLRSRMNWSYRLDHWGSHENWKVNI